MLQIRASGERCLCDFTFDFYWQHKGSRLDPDSEVGGKSFRRLVEALRQGETIEISGDVGSRLGSSMGVDLLRLGGRGGPIEKTGSLVVDGDAGSRMGISMLRGAIYLSGRVESPLGNVVQVESDRSGFQKFVSITEVLEKSIPVLEPNALDQTGLFIRDGHLRDTIGARNPTKRTVRLECDAGMSTGILMQSGIIEVEGDAGQNTGVLMRGGRVVVRKNTGDFTGAEMRGGEVYVAGRIGGFACARMKGGAVYAKDARPLPPARAQMLSPSEQRDLAGVLGQSPLYAMMYRKFSL
jgi:formylmethanofuran dehydrogenase subunit C